MTKLFLGVAFATLAFTGIAAAQSYPTRPITMIVPYGAGGPVDVLARRCSSRCGRRSASRS